MSRYTYQIEPGAKRGTWQYQITGPDGEPSCWGACIGRKAEVEAQLEKVCRRLNGGPLGITNHTPKSDGTTGN